MESESDVVAKPPQRRPVHWCTCMKVDLSLPVPCALCTLPCLHDLRGIILSLSPKVSQSIYFKLASEIDVQGNEALLLLCSLLRQWVKGSKVVYLLLHSK